MLLIRPDSSYAPRLGGVMMQRFYLKYDTAIMAMNVYCCDTEEQLLQHIAKASVRHRLSTHSQEFLEYPIKQGQKTFLNAVYAKRGKFHYAGKVKETSHKVVCLLMVGVAVPRSPQCVLGGIKIEDLAMTLEADSVALGSSGEG